MGDLEGLPPGFRFHPTEEELVCYYLRNKHLHQKAAAFLHFDLIRDIDVYDYDPFDLPAKLGFNNGNHTNFYFFTAMTNNPAPGFCENRAAKSGIWRMTGLDRPVVSRSEGVVGMMKTLVFYWGQFPELQKTDWVMNEYVLLGADRYLSAAAGQDFFALCHVFRKSHAVHKAKEHFRSAHDGGDITNIPDQQHHGTSLSGIVEVDVEDKTMVASSDDGDELHKLLMEFTDEPNDASAGTFLFPRDKSVNQPSNHLHKLFSSSRKTSQVNLDSEFRYGIASDDLTRMAILDGDFMELKDLLFPLTDSGVDHDIRGHPPNAPKFTVIEFNREHHLSRFVALNGTSGIWPRRETTREENICGDILSSKLDSCSVDPCTRGGLTEKKK